MVLLGFVGVLKGFIMLCDHCVKMGMLMMLSLVDVQRVDIAGKKVFQMDMVCPHCNAEYTWSATSFEPQFKEEKKAKI